MKNFKKVSGERIVAALVDYVAIYIMGLIISFIPMIFLGFDGFIDMLFGSALEPSVGAGEMPEGFIIYTMITVYAQVVLGLVYFVVVPRLWNGQTVGKKLLKLKAINEYGENPSLWQHFVRAIQNWTTYYTALIGWVIMINYLAFTLLSIGSFLVSILFLISFIMLLAREDGRGIHDMISGTYVIKADENLDKDFVETTAQMGDWIEVEDQDDQWDKKKEEKSDEDDWSF